MKKRWGGCPVVNQGISQVLFGVCVFWVNCVFVENELKELKFCLCKNSWDF